MKILSVNMSIDSIRGGGTAERTVQMAKALAEAGHDSSILTLNLGITEVRKKELQNVELFTLPCLNERIYLPFPSLFKISTIISKVDIVHLMGHWTIINSLVYLFIRIHKKKYVVCPAGALPIFGRSKIIKLLYNFVIGKSIIKNSNKQILIAMDEVEHFKPYGITSNKNMMWIPNGIDPKNLEAQNNNLFRKTFKLDDSPFIIFIGRLNLIKGPDLLLEAFCSVKNQFPNMHLVFAGPDEGMLPALKKIASLSQIENRVHFIGHISGELKSQGLHAAKLMVIPSRHEAMSIVVLEAGVVGLPVLLTDQCGLNNLKELNAAIITTASAEGIREGLINNLSKNEELIEMGLKLKAHVFENYLWSGIVKKIEELYRKTLAGS